MKTYYVRPMSATVGLCDMHAEAIKDRSNTSFGEDSQCAYCQFNGYNPEPIYQAIKELHNLYSRGDIKQIVWDEPGYNGTSGIIIAKLQYGIQPYPVSAIRDIDNNKWTISYRGRQRKVKVK